MEGEDIKECKVLEVLVEIGEGNMIINKNDNIENIL
jgi:hypothetical protein